MPPACLPGGRLFASCHFSLYPLLFGILATGSSSRRVVSLVGNQSPAHRAQLQALAGRFDVDLRFVSGGFRVLRDMRQALADGHHALVLIDIPWSRSGSALDAEHTASGGRFRARSSLYRLIAAIDPHARFVLVERDSDSFRLVDHGPADAGLNYASFAEALKRDPADYERLHQFHQFFDFDRPGQTAVYLSVGSDHYLVCGTTMKAWRLGDATARARPGDVVRTGHFLDQCRQLTGSHVSEVIAV